MKLILAVLLGAAAALGAPPPTPPTRPASTNVDLRIIGTNVYDFSPLVAARQVHPYEVSGLVLASDAIGVMLQRATRVTYLLLPDLIDRLPPTVYTDLLNSLRHSLGRQSVFQISELEYRRDGALHPYYERRELAHERVFVKDAPGHAVGLAARFLALPAGTMVIDRTPLKCYAHGKPYKGIQGAETIYRVTPTGIVARTGNGTKPNSQKSSPAENRSHVKGM